MLGQLGAILEQLGDKMKPKSAKMSQDGAQERQDEARYANLGAGGSSWGVGIHAAAGGRPPCTPLRMDSPEWDSSMDLQTPTPAGTGSGKLDPGKLEDWKTGSGILENLPSARLYTQLCLRHGGGYIYIYIYNYISIHIYIYMYIIFQDS